MADDLLCDVGFYRPSTIISTWVVVVLAKRSTQIVGDLSVFLYWIDQNSIPKYTIDKSGRPTASNSSCSRFESKYTILTVSCAHEGEVPKVFHKSIGQSLMIPLSTRLTHKKFHPLKASILCDQFDFFPTKTDLPVTSRVSKLNLFNLSLSESRNVWMRAYIHERSIYFLGKLI